MSAKEKSEIIALVTGSELPCRRALAQLGLPRSTYYRWLKRQTESRLEDREGGSSRAICLGTRRQAVRKGSSPLPAGFVVSRSPLDKW